MSDENPDGDVVDAPAESPDDNEEKEETLQADAEAAQDASLPPGESVAPAGEPAAPAEDAPAEDAPANQDDEVVAAEPEQQPEAEAEKEDEALGSNVEAKEPEDAPQQDEEPGTAEDKPQPEVQEDQATAQADEKEEEQAPEAKQDNDAEQEGDDGEGEDAEEGDDAEGEDAEEGDDDEEKMGKKNKKKAASKKAVASKKAAATPAKPASPADKPKSTAKAEHKEAAAEHTSASGLTQVHSSKEAHDELDEMAKQQAHEVIKSRQSSEKRSSSSSHTAAAPLATVEANTLLSETAQRTPSGPWLTGHYKLPKTGKIITGEELCGSLERMTNAYIDKYAKANQGGANTLPYIGTGTHMYQPKKVSQEELDTVISRLYQQKDRSASDEKLERVTLRYGEGNKEQWVPVKKVNSDEQQAYMCELYSRCLETKKKTAEDLATKYLKPLGQPRKMV